MNKEEAIKQAHDMYAYETSEKADQESGVFDDLWQSIYDVCHLAKVGVLDDIEDDEVAQAKLWLKKTQVLTKDYKQKEIDF